jgi:hypothetical protein
MRIIELFEDLPSIPGLAPSVNQSGLKNNIKTATPGVANSANINTNSQAVKPIDPAISQQLSTRGSTIQLPSGPTNQPTNFKITGMDNQTGNVTLNNPQSPNQPGVSYSKTQLAQMIAASKPTM